MTKWRVGAAGASIFVCEAVDRPGVYQCFEVSGDGGITQARKRAHQVLAFGDLSIHDMLEALPQFGRVEAYNEKLVIVLPKATLVRQGEFGMNYGARPVRDLRVWLGPYAGNYSAVHASYVLKGERKPRGFVQEKDPTLVVLEGWVNPTLPGLGKATSSKGMTVTSSSDLSFASSWGEEARKALQRSGHKMVADFHGHNTYARI